MILINDFYSIKETQKIDGGVNFAVRLNADHFIYAAHFPENPITPGVCITQMVKELTEETVQTPLSLKVAKNIKFTQIINPLLYPEVTFALSIQQDDDKNGYKVNATVAKDNIIFTKLSLQFIVKRNG